MGTGPMIPVPAAGAMHADRRLMPSRARAALIAAAAVLALISALYAGTGRQSVGAPAGKASSARFASGLQSSFTASGASVRSGSTTVALGLRGLGYGSKLAPVPGALPRIQAGRTIYARPDVTEWYVRSNGGLEQGFTVIRRPAGDDRGPLTLSIGVASNARSALSAAGHSVLFTRAGAPTLAYGDLSASDARGRSLHSWMEMRGGRLLLRVDARGAAYPVRIDPFVQQGEKLTAAGEIGTGQVGNRVALSADGNTAIVGGGGDNGGVGAAWVFTRSGSTWTQQAKITGGEESGSAHFGHSVALSADGNTALIGGYLDKGGAGAAWVFTRSGSTWTQQGPKLVGGEEVGAGELGFSASLSDDGNTALVAGGEDNGGVGAAWVFTRSGSTWTQQGPKLVGGEEAGAGHFGHSVSLSGDGSSALVGGYLDKEGQGSAWLFTRSGSTWSQQLRSSGSGGFPNGEYGIEVAFSGDGGTALISDVVFAGRVHVFKRSGSTLREQALFTGPRDANVELGSSLALSSDGSTALVGAAGEHKGIGSSWTFQRSGENWSIQAGGKITGAGESGAARFGESVALSGDAGTALVGGPQDAAGTGAAWPFTWSPPAPPEPPEFGHCIQPEPNTGAFANSKCTVAELQGAYAWQPGAEGKFTTKITEGVATLQTVKGTKVVCSGQTGSGEYSGTKAVAGVVLTFTGCELGGEKCSSPSAGAGELSTSALGGVLGVTATAETPLKEKVGLDLVPSAEGAPFMQFTCGATAVSVRGSVILPVLTNKPVTTAKLKFTAAKGKQKPERFVEGPKDVLEASFNNGPFEQLGLNVKITQVNEKALEISTIT